MGCLTDKDDSLSLPALRVVGNLLTGSNEVVDILIDNQVIPSLAKLLDHSKQSVRKETCWAVSNILAGETHQIEQILSYNDQEIIGKLVRMVYGDTPDVFIFASTSTYLLRSQENVFIV